MFRAGQFGARGYVNVDERTRRTDENLRDQDLAPGARRLIPEPFKPWVKAPPRSRVRIGIGIVVLLLVALGIYETARWVQTATPSGGRFPQGALQTVGASTAVLGDVRVILNELGTVTPLATVTVQTQINGQFTEVGFTEGQSVKKGDFLAQIDPRPYEYLKEQYEGQLARDQGLLAQAQMDQKRYATLAQQNSIARQQAEDQVFIVQQYAGAVKQDQGLVDAQALNISYCRIVSPITGRVGLRLVDPGNYVQTTNSTGIAVITQLQPISVVFSMPEDELPDTAPQFAAGAPLLVTAYDRSNLRQLAVGKVSAIDNQIDTTTGTVKVRAQFDNEDNTLFPNQFVNVRLLVKTLQNVVTVPTSAIQRGAPGTYVYVINADNTVSVRQVSTGPIDGNVTAINSGLSAGDRVVIDGTDRLRDGIKVIVVAGEGRQTGAPAGAPTATPGAVPNRGQPSGQHSGSSQNRPPSGNQ
jgi:multidrug efflux system membrane fusion protein